MKKLFIKLIRFYQKRISPLTPPRCRFYPSCSQYAILAIEKYGIFIGLFKAIWRILRCNPFCKGGIDYP
ncbi:MAG: membrane protein insertion efficiency factor YidD [Oscillospiraceae bacterium]